MKILVTGGAGFIGSHVVDAYINAGHTVVVIDNLSTGNRKNLNPKAIFHAIDLRNQSAVASVIAHEQPEIINHHAAIAAVTVSTGSPMETYETNVIGTLSLLSASRGIKKFIFSSTGGAMYGTPKKYPSAETEERTPASPYGLSKLLAEDAIKYYANEFKFPYLIFRYANAFGPRQNPKGEAGVIAIFSGLLSQGKTPIVYNKGATRDYVYVADIAHANVLALSTGMNVTLNIGLGKEISNQQVFEAVAKEYQWRGEPQYQPARPGELLRSSLDAKQAKKILGWSPTTDLATGIRNIHDTQA